MLLSLIDMTEECKCQLVRDTVWLRSAHDDWSRDVPSPETDLEAWLLEAKCSPLLWKRKLRELEASQLCRRPPEEARVAEEMASYGACFCSRRALRTHETRAHGQYGPARCVAHQTHCATCLKESQEKKRMVHAPRVVQPRLPSPGSASQTSLVAN